MPVVNDARMRRRLAMAGLALAAACYQGEISIGESNWARELPPGFVVVADIAPTSTRALDILFVIDDSESMREEQEALRASLGRSLVDVLDARFGGRPDLHIGVVSTDMGANATIPNCASSDGGRLQTGAGSAGCEPPSGMFIEDIGTGTGRATNYQGTLDQALGCMVELGTGGCGFEQPLQAMRRALDGSNPENAGFLREDAMLAVVFLTDEDDCSAADSGLFAPEQAGLDQALGPLTSFRCFDFGVTCDQADAREPGTKTGCRPRADSPYLHGVQAYVDFLRARKPAPGMVVVAGIIGDAAPVTVSLDTNATGEPYLSLQPTCTSPAGAAIPSVRLSAFLDAFPARGARGSICTADVAEPLARVSELVAGSALGTACLLGPLADTDTGTAGVQPDCQASELRDAGTAAETRSSLPACAAAPADTRCFTIAADPQTCGHTETGLAVALAGDGAAATQARVQVACLAP